MKHNVYRAEDQHSLVRNDPFHFDKTVEGQLRAIVKMVDSVGEEIVSVVPHGGGLLVITKTS